MYATCMRRFVTFCKIAPYRNSLTYVLTYAMENIRNKEEVIGVVKDKEDIHDDTRRSRVF